MNSNNSNYRSELLVPINRVDRSYEEWQQASHSHPYQPPSQQQQQQQRGVPDKFANPPGYVSSPTSIRSLQSNTPSASSRSLLDNHHQPRPLATLHDDWYQDVVGRMELRRRRWEDEMRQMREEFFQLKPSHLDFDDLTGWSATESPSLFRRPMWVRPNEADDFQPHGRQRSDDAMLGRSTSNNDLIVTDKMFEQDDDGQLFFRAQFDVSGYAMEDISVTTKEQRLTVTARKTVTTPTSSSSKEFSRTLDLPKNVPADKLTCTLTSNGVLILSSPVECPSYLTASNSGSLNSGSVSRDPLSSTSTFQPPDDRNSTYSPASFNEDMSYKSTAVTHHPSSRGASAASISNHTSRNTFPAQSEHHSTPPPTQGEANTNLSMNSSVDVDRREFRISVEVGDEYLPSEISVKTNEQKVFVHARHAETVANRTAFREFSKEFDVPSNVDPQTITAKFQRGVLYLTAPIITSRELRGDVMM